MWKQVFWTGRSCFLLRTSSSSGPLASQFSTGTDVSVPVSEISRQFFPQPPLLSISFKFLPCVKLKCQLSPVRMSTNKKGNLKSGSTPSTTDPGRKLSIIVDGQAQEPAPECPSPAEYVDSEDEFILPRSRRTKAAKAAKRNFSKGGAQGSSMSQPRTRSQTQVKIKQEPVTPPKANSQGAVDKPLPYKNIQEYLDSQEKPKPIPKLKILPLLAGSAPAGECSGSTPGSQPTTKPIPGTSVAAATTSGRPNDSGIGESNPDVSLDGAASGLNTSGQIPPPSATSTPAKPSRSSPAKAPPSSPARTPTRPGTSSGTPVRRSPRLKKEYNSSPGKNTIENRLLDSSRFPGFARKKVAQNSIPEEPESQGDKGEDSGLGNDVSREESMAKPYFRAPYSFPDPRAELNTPRGVQPVPVPVSGGVPVGPLIDLSGLDRPQYLSQVQNQMAQIQNQANAHPPSQGFRSDRNRAAKLQAPKDRPESQQPSATSSLGQAVHEAQGFFSHSRSSSQPNQAEPAQSQSQAKAEGAAMQTHGGGFQPNLIDFSNNSALQGGSIAPPPNAWGVPSSHPGENERNSQFEAAFPPLSGQFPPLNSHSQNSRDNTNPNRVSLAGEAVAGVAGSSLTTTQPPHPPPCPPRALPIPAGQRCTAVGPLGLESPASSNTTEILSDTVKTGHNAAEEEDEVDPHDDTVVEGISIDEAEKLLRKEEGEDDMLTNQAGEVNLDDCMEWQEGEQQQPQAQALPPPPQNQLVIPPTQDQFTANMGGSRMPEMSVPAPSEHRHPSEMMDTGMAVMIPTKFQAVVPAPAPQQTYHPSAANLQFDPLIAPPQPPPEQVPPPPPPSSTATPAPAQVSVAESVMEERRVSTTITDQATGQTQVINQTQKKIALNNAGYDAQGRPIFGQSSASGEQRSNVVSYPPHFYPQVNAAAPASGLPAADAALAEIGGWDADMESEEADRETAASLSTASAPTSAPPQPPPAVSVQPGPSTSGAGSTVASAAAPPAPQLIRVPVNQRPPPSRIPKDPMYEDRGIEQRDLDNHQWKLWCQEDRLREAEILFGTRDHIQNPTPQTQDFFNRTGYRQDVTMNHIMAALRNTPYATTSSDLLDASRQPGVEQANARSLLMDVAVSNMMVQKKQKAAGLRSAKGRRRTPEEAKAALEVREIQLRLQEARRLKNQGKKPASNSAQPGASQSQDDEGGSRGRGKGKETSRNRPKNSQSRPPPSEPQPGPSNRSRQDQASAQEPADRDRSRSQTGRGRGRGGRGRSRTPASDRLGRSANLEPIASTSGKNSRPNNQNQNQNQSNFNANAQISGQGSSQATASISGTVRSQENGARVGTGSGLRRQPNPDVPNSSNDSALSLSQSSHASEPQPDANHSITDQSSQSASGQNAGDHIPQPPPENDVDSVRLIVSGHLGHPQEIDIAEGEAKSRLMPWIGKEVMATQRAGAQRQITLRSMTYQSGRIVIHPCNQEAGERLAVKIREEMHSENHPAGFSAEFNESLDQVAELTIRCPQMGRPEQVRGLIEAVDGGLVTLNLANGGWPAGLSAGEVRYLRHWDEPSGGLRVIRFTATRRVVEAIMSPPHSGEAYIGYLMGTVKHDRSDVKPGTQINYKRPFAE